MKRRCCEKNKMDVLIVFSILMLTVKSSLAETIEFRMLEEQNTGYVIGNILEKYNSDRSELRFILMKREKSYEGMFDVDEISGNLTTKQTIDREELCEFTIVCEISLEIAAQTNQNDGFFDVIETRVIIEDINDNAPLFSQTSLDIPISESVLTGGFSTIDGARDKDTSAQFSLQKYEIQPKTLGEALPFSISFSKNLDGSSTVKLIVNEKLNRETKDSYQFYIIAKDGGSPPKDGSLFVTAIITDINDNYPEFDKASYNVTVREEVSIGSTILEIKATDTDIGSNGLVRFRLSPRQPSENLKYFTIEELTGDLKIKESLSQVSKSQFKLIVEAIDQGDVPLTSQTFVEVTVLDTLNSPPEVHINVLPNGDFAKISEYANVGAVVAHVAVTEHDTGRNGDVNCSIKSDSDAFTLSKYDNKEYKVTVSRSLDREITAIHNVTVKCSDKGVPPLNSASSFLVQISDENDNAPRFEQQRYFVNMDENNDIGDKITTVNAYDFDAGNNRDIEYFMDPRSTPYAFVNPDTGDVMANRVFDKESADGSGFSLTIYAKDKGSPSLTGTTTVIVTLNDVNDNRPLFDKPLFRFWLDENLPADTLVGRLTAKDADAGNNNLTRFSMKPDGPSVPFVVIRDGTIKTNRELDREMQSQYMFEVIASDVGDATLFTTAAVTVFITDVNDNGPVIDLPRPGNNTVHISHLTQSGSVIYRVIAFDRDEADTENSNLRYSLATVNSTSLFSINENSGEVVLRAPLENTNYINKVFIMKLKVSDLGDNSHGASATLRVVVVTGNGTVESLVEEPNKNFVIVVVVATVTVVISAGIIVTICIIRHLDTRRRNEKGRQKVLSQNMYARNTDEVDNIFPLPLDASYNDKKKKEVSFSLENGGVGGMESHQMNRSLDDPAHDSFDHNILLEPPPQYQLGVPRGKLDDCHSDMSGESAGDSGKGGSDDDLQITNLSFTRDEIQRSKDTWNNGRSKSPGVHQMQSFPTRYSHTNNTLPQQKIVPYSFKKNQTTYPSNGLINNLQSPPSSSYSMPTYYDDEGHSSSGFHSSIDSNSNFNINQFRNGGKLNLNRGKISDCVV